MKRGALALALPVLPLFFLSAPPLASVVQANGTRAQVVHREGSFYGQISVVDYSYPQTRVCYLAGAGEGRVCGFTLAGRLDGGLRSSPKPRFLPVHPMALAALDGFLQRTYTLRATDGSIYTDDWAPMEAQAAEVKILWREAEIEATPAEILLD